MAGVDCGMIRYHTEEQLAAAVKAGTKSRFLVGCDLGQANDPTAISVSERIDTPRLQIKQGRQTGEVEYDTTFDVRHLDRMPLNTSYVDVVGHLEKMMATAPLVGNADLVVDRTGVGRGVFDMLVKANLRPVGVTITAGHGSSQKGRNFWVSKLELVSFMVAAHHQGILRISDKLKHAKTLEQEFKNFQLKYTDKGNATFSAREGLHDDLVLSLAIAVWYSRRREGARVTAYRVEGH